MMQLGTLEVQASASGRPAALTNQRPSPLSLPRIRLGGEGRALLAALANQGPRQLALRRVRAHVQARGRHDHQTTALRMMIMMMIMVGGEEKERGLTSDHA
mmetsp:Transcript_89937/g.290543  ORF Transcript_89937/g.290543 Transcript_89937/m.290543 type:complete len:101 (-) Transcript_89937:723-1025(-)